MVRTCSGTLFWQNPLARWLGLMVFLGLFFMTVVWMVYQKEYGQTRVKAEQSAETYRVLTRAILVDIDRILVRAGEQFLLQGASNGELVSQVLREHGSVAPHLMGVLITDARGDVQVWPSDLPAPIVRDRSYIRYHQEFPDTGLFMSEPMLSRVHGDRWFLALSRAVRDGSGNLLGVAAGMLDTAVVEGIFRGLVSDPASSVSLIHQSGRLVLRSPNGILGVGDEVQGLTGVEFPVLERQTLDVARGLDGQRRLVNVYPLEGFPLVVTGALNLDAARETALAVAAGLTALWLAIATVSFLAAMALSRAWRRERRAQELYQSVFDGVSDPVCLLQVESSGQRFRFVAANGAWRSVTGGDSTRLLERTPDDIWPPDTAVVLNRLCQRALASPCQEEAELDLGGGLRVWRLALDPLQGSGGDSQLVVMLHDITEQSRLARIAASLPGFVYQLYRGPRGEFRYLSASANVANYFGVTTEQVLADADCLLGMIHPDDFERVMTESLDTAARHVTWHSRFRMVRPDGRMLWIEARDTPVTDPDGGILWTGYANDITELVALEEALRQSEAKFRMFVERANDIIYTVSSGGLLTYVSPNGTNVLGYSLEEMTGHSIADFVHPEDLPRCQAYLADVLAGNQRPEEVEYRVRHRNGEWRWHTSTGSRLGEDGLHGYLGVARDITERKLAEQRIAHLAHYDLLTDLPNRALFFELGERALNQARREGKLCALLFADLDFFKPVNDRHGHAIGDILLQQVAARMVRCVRGSDVVARIGGDEFLVLLPGLDAPEQARVPAAKILKALAQPFEIEGRRLEITCSIGIALFPAHAGDMATLARRADEAMYAAKRQGRNGIHVHAGVEHAGGREGRSPG